MTNTRETSTRETHSQTTSNESSTELRADIENKRHEMSHKIDAIQEQFQPERLREQAGETIRGVVDDGVHALRDYVSDNGQDIGASVGRAIKNHPVPAALVGIGLGWMLIDSLSGDSDSYGSRQRYYRGDTYGSPRYGATEYGYGSRHFERAEMYGLEGYPEEYVDEMSGERYNRGIDYGTDPEHRYRQQSPAHYENMNYGYNPNRGAADYSRDDSDDDQGIVDRVQDAAQSAVNQVQEGAQTVTNQVQNQAENIAGGAQRYSEQARRQTQHRADQWSSEAQHQAQRAQQEARRAGRQAYRTIEDNPLTFGAVALGLGVAIGLALPETRQEDRLLGDTRDRVFDAAQGAAGDVANRAQNVVEEVRPEVEQTARKVANDLQDAGREAVNDLTQAGQESAQAVKETAQDAADKTREEAKGAKHDVEKRAQNAKDDVSDKVTPQG